MELPSLVLFVADLGVLISEEDVRGCEPLLLDDGNLQKTQKQFYNKFYSPRV
jgi:hypothetical protein